MDAARAAELLPEIASMQAANEGLAAVNEALREIARLQADAVVSLVSLLPAVVSQPGSLDVVADGIGHCRKTLGVIVGVQPALEDVVAVLEARLAMLQDEVAA